MAYYENEIDTTEGAYPACPRFVPSLDRLQVFRICEVKKPSFAISMDLSYHKEAPREMRRRSPNIIAFNGDCSVYLSQLTTGLS